ncbi:MAG: carbohydrate ABC transporter permease [Bacilli bacterium]|jgi:multiple sugar transport system permease protein|nr:carbohydrate ABC transporter permease [Bacilli bacterium]MDD4005936.1 carbohydrate ABC transporter permease [Bacilli bacterium]
MAEHEIYFTSRKQMMLYKGQKIFTQVLLYAFLTLFGLFIVFPFFYMVVTSMKSEILYDSEAARKLISLVPQFESVYGLNDQGNFVRTWQLFDNYRIVLDSSNNFFVYYMNTIIVSVVSTAFTVVTAVLAAFAFARLEFKGKNLLFTIILATMMVPGEMMVITNFQTAATWGWQNTYAALIFVHGVSVFYIFYLRQTFQQIPNELFLAAKVDGYGHFRYLWRVMVPIGMPTIVTIIILSLMGSWNAFIWPNLIASGTNPTFGHTMRLVSNGLMSLFQGEYSSEDTIKVAASMVITLPLFVFFLIFRKFIMRGVSRSGIKG